MVNVSGLEKEHVETLHKTYTLIEMKTITKNWSMTQEPT